MINEEIVFEKLTVDEESMVRAGTIYDTSCDEPFPDPGGACGRPDWPCWIIIVEGG
jgi:hypothetical protein